MTAAKHRLLWKLLLPIAIGAILGIVGVRYSMDQLGTTIALPSEPPLARVCVTRHGFCPVGLVRVGDPCSCPDTLYGNVPGRVELVRDASNQAKTRNWPERYLEDPLENLGPLVGP